MVTHEIYSKETKELISILNQWIAHESELKKLNLDKERRMKETINGLSHDIRTPLTSLDGYCQLLSECEDQTQRQKYLAIMTDRIDSLKTLIEELFLYTKLQNKTYQLKLLDVDINQLVFDTVFSFFEDFTQRDIVPRIELSENPVIVNGDETALKRVFQNIIKNALEHGCNDFALELIEEKQKVILRFTNSYHNLEKIDPERIFERFYKGDKTRKKTSTGLGLAIAKELIERMNGTVLVDVDDTVFSVSITFANGK
ncbi:sensor histidine kinase [Amphibacillus sp. Q70]|uniref:sensor histidine kinase n=1 Tax=Amphibacillus sp. Q70 TaxID=3453416 RepID=UPI003F8280BA